MLPFSVHLRRGEPTHQQVLAAVREALATGQLRDGDPFPSVRVLTQELRISPSAAQKVVATLREDGLLAQQQGSGLTVRSGSGLKAMSPSDSEGLSGMPTLTDAAVSAFGTGSAVFGFPFLSGSEDAVAGRIDSYEVEGLLARGGMGIVFKAHDHALMRPVAVKVLAPQIAASEEARARFLREARAAAAVDHENVLPVHAVGEIMGFPYLVMPLVHGESLQARLEREGALPIDELLRVAEGAGRGLAAAHARGLVHRDIKPDNILLETGEGTRVWIADFGLARALEDPGLTRTGVIAGTPQFSSPEQVEGKELDARADLFSFGALLYAMATGSPPFQGETFVVLFRKIIEDAPVPPRAERPDLPEKLEELIVALLAKSPDERPGETAEVVRVLGKIRQEL